MKIATVFLCGVSSAAMATWLLQTPSNESSSDAPAPFDTGSVESHAAEKPVLPEVVADQDQAVRLTDLLSRLERGRGWLQTVPDYTAKFYRQERVNGELRDPETTELKLRHQPFSVTMVWTNDGKTAHYREGRNSDRVAVRLGGWRRRLGWINLNPHGSLAMDESRYAITDVGLLRLTEQLLEKFEPYRNVEGIRCAWLPDETIGGRSCRVFQVEYASHEMNPEYRQSTVWLDREWNVPLSVRNTDWDMSPSNPDGLIEHYVYEDVQLDRRLTDGDFSVDAPSDTNVAAAAE